MANLQKIYSDIDLTFNKQPTSKDVSIVYDDRAVINSVRNLLLTNHYDRLWQPSLGSNITGLLFENISPVMETAIQKEIENTIKNFEPRVTISTIKVTANESRNGYNVYCSFFIGNNPLQSTVNIFLERDR